MSRIITAHVLYKVVSVQAERPHSRHFAERVHSRYFAEWYHMFCFHSSEGAELPEQPCLKLYRHMRYIKWSACDLKGCTPDTLLKRSSTGILPTLFNITHHCHTTTYISFVFVASLFFFPLLVHELCYL